MKTIFRLLCTCIAFTCGINDEKGCNNFTFYNDNQQQQKAQTLSGWSNFVGRQTLFDQLNKLKKNMYSANNGRQHQSNKFHTFNKNWDDDYKDNQMDGFAIRSKNIKSEKHIEEYVDSQDRENRVGQQMNSLPHIGRCYK